MDEGRLRALKFGFQRAGLAAIRPSSERQEAGCPEEPPITAAAVSTASSSRDGAIEGSAEIDFC